MEADYAFEFGCLTPSLCRPNVTSDLLRQSFPDLEGKKPRIRSKSSVAISREMLPVGAPGCMTHNKERKQSRCTGVDDKEGKQSRCADGRRNSNACQDATSMFGRSRCEFEKDESVDHALESLGEHVLDYAHAATHRPFLPVSPD